MSTANWVTKLGLMSNDLDTPGVEMADKINAIQAVLEALIPLSVKVSTPAADSVADMNAGLILLGSGVDITGVTPQRAGQILVIWCTASGTDPTATCGTGVTINATGNNKMTFPDADDAMVLIAASTTRWNIILNIGSVTVSTV